MNFLKKIGKGVIKILSFMTNHRGEIARVLTPFVGAAGLTTLGLVAGVVAEVEHYFTTAFGDKKLSSEKLTAALPLVSLTLRHSELLLGREVVDEDRFTEGCRKIIAGVVDVLHAVDDRKYAPEKSVEAA